MSLHQNRRLWQKHVLAENRRSVPGLLETLVAEPVYKIMATGEEHRGPKAVADFYNGLFQAMPDATFDLLAVTVGEEAVVEESVLRGTHRGPWLGFAPTGRRVELPLTIVFPIQGGRFLGERMYFDMGTLRRCLEQPE